jgi:translation initiation factor 1
MRAAARGRSSLPARSAFATAGASGASQLAREAEDEDDGVVSPDPSKNRIVYSSGGGRACPRCGWPEASCRCASRIAPAGEPVPDRITVRLRIEKKGRGGKTVTLVEGLPRNAKFVAELARDLKRACGVGGGVAENSVELQGDQRDRLRELLTGRGMTVKG